MASTCISKHPVSNIENSVDQGEILAPMLTHGKHVIEASGDLRGRSEDLGIWCSIGCDEQAGRIAPWDQLKAKTRRYGRPPVLFLFEEDFSGHGEVSKVAR